MYRTIGTKLVVMELYGARLVILKHRPFGEFGWNGSTLGKELKSPPDT